MGYPLNRYLSNAGTGRFYRICTNFKISLAKLCLMRHCERSAAIFWPGLSHQEIAASLALLAMTH